MRYKIGEQVWVKSKGVIEIINEVEQIAGQYIYYTFDGNSYGEKEVDKYGLYYHKINKIFNKLDLSVKIHHPESLTYKGMYKRFMEMEVQVEKEKNNKKNKKSW